MKQENFALFWALSIALAALAGIALRTAYPPHDTLAYTDAKPGIALRDIHR